MTKKTRIRVARIAAGAVIAAGASLTAAGAASALDLNVQAGPISLGASVDGPDGGGDADGGCPVSICTDGGQTDGGNDTTTGGDQTTGGDDTTTGGD
ncbi:hypothetical protein ACFZBJ_12415, partial [Streptomyces murinus]